MRKVIIMGAAGRDFHNFNTFFRNNSDYRVVAFTATQIPRIEGRLYPPELAGPNYPKGIPIYLESELAEIIKREKVNVVVFSYSDVTNQKVMSASAIAMSAGATFMLLGTKDTMLKSSKPVISICAARTGSGKSQTTRYVANMLKETGCKIAIIRHPMPYGNLIKQRVQRFATMDDLNKHNCTIEEREEYEPHIKNGFIVYAGVDYEAIIRDAEKEADIILWDGGNNDFPFYFPDIHIVVVDPLRAGDELSHFPSELNLRLADIVIINKVDTADYEAIALTRENIKSVNSKATIIEAASPIYVDKPELISGKRVVVVEDGPTLTHGGMSFGAGIIAAKRFGASEIIEPYDYAVGSLKRTLEKFSHLTSLLPAMGYYPEQIEDLRQSLENTPADTIVSATPIDLTRLFKLAKPIVPVRYELQVIGKPCLKELILPRIKKWSF